MQINIRNKIRSLLRRKQPFFCLSYDWESKQINVHTNHDDYFSIISKHLDNGFVKRTECYLPELIDIAGNQQFMIYMVSFGDFRRAKMIYGENPVAKGFGVCMFDFVYFFVEEKGFAERKMRFRIQELDKQGEYFYAELMRDVYYRHFEENGEESNRTFEESGSVMKQGDEQSGNMGQSGDMGKNERIWSHHQFPCFHKMEIEEQKEIPQKI